ncbi:MAG: hypothetical protein FJ109_08870 [Deltaproteobacteria bacterium]|nr:hypothetical protein [Deltaproteobacteria bacterium]
MRTGNLCTLLVLLPALALGAACDGGEDGESTGEKECTPATTSCDPLAPRETSITIDKPLAVGKAADGQLFVLAEDSEHAEELVFVSDGSTLIRKKVLGAGIMGLAGEGDRYEVSYADGDEERRLFVDVKPTGASNMKVCDGEALWGKGQEPPADACQPLTVVGEEALDGYEVQSLPGTMLVEYYAKVADGTLIVVVRPEHDCGYEDFRLFWGEPGKMIEHKVLNVVRFSDGGTTDITFETCQGVAFVHFNNSLTADDGVDWSGCYLHIGGSDGDEIEVTRMGEDAYDPNGKEFLCL